MEESKEIKFRFERTPAFKLFYVGGVWGSVSPGGEIYAEFFTDIFPHPRSITFDASTGLLNETTREADDRTILRQFEFGVVMNVQTAAVLREWLDTRIGEYQKRQESQPKMEPNEDFEVR
jgi:hypothetical protein